MAELSPEDRDRKLRAKRVNERLKLFASSINTIALTLLGAAALVPLVSGVFAISSIPWFFVAVGLHFVAQLVLGRLKSEEWPMELPLWYMLGVPLGALMLGLVGLAWAYVASERFDRRYGKRG